MTSLNYERRILNDHYSKSFQTLHHEGELNQWRNLTEIPTSKEICPDDIIARPRDPPEDPKDWAAYQKDPIYDPNLPTNIIDGPWPSKEEYIAAHYQILREDAISSLRRSVMAFKANPSIKDDDNTVIYTQVSFVGYQLARSGAACRICFSTERALKRINWKVSKRLVQGTLVALTPVGDLFQSICRVAVVAARPFEGGLDQNPPQIDLFWGDISQVEIDPSEKYIMVEAREGYFEASRHMLVALQKLMTEKFQLADHIVKLDRDVKAPEYLEDNPYMDLTTLELPSYGKEIEKSLLNVDVLRNFPDQELNSGMDDSQLQACKSMLTKSVSIVQGPPGTGKTFVSICALKAMIQSLEHDAPPIIVSAQTNHALDQLLNHIMKFEPNILRLGGRSDKENIEIRKRTPFELRQNNQIPGGTFGLGQCRKEWERLIKEIETILAPLKRQGLITADSLVEKGIITEKQRDSLCEDGWSNGDVSDGTELENWLGGDLDKITKAKPGDMNLPMEENEDEEEEKLLDRQEISAVLPGPDDNDREALNGTWVSFERKLTGRAKGQIQRRKCKKFLRTHNDLYDLPEGERGELYRYFEIEYDGDMLVKFREALGKYEKMLREYQVTKGLCNINLVRQLGIKVIGCTTTGLSKYRALLSALQPRTLLIEEAAETLEGYIMGGMLNSLQQLMLIGDHLQLQASCTVKQLEESPYFMKVSMFERLVNNSFEFVMLNRQRRMIPEIRKLLCIQPTPFYTNLHDHEIVKNRANRPPVPGMGGIDSYFFHHNWPEARNQDGSCYNEDEAQMIVGFFHYLILNGVDASKITVLTFYNGQRKLILQKLKREPGLGGHAYFNVFTVDSYQGEENDIILLSLVRSNIHYGVGFLDNRNRVVVALSRARCGLYLFGNVVTLTAAENGPDAWGREPLWSPLIQHMGSTGNLDINSGLPLTCKRHGRTTIANDPEDWVRKAGGCNFKCELGPLPCGHPCTALCHPFSHDVMVCQAPCAKKLLCGHGCSRCCGDQCFCDRCVITILPYESNSEVGIELRDYRSPNRPMPTLAMSGNESRNYQTPNRPLPSSAMSGATSSTRSVDNDMSQEHGSRQMVDRTRPKMAQPTNARSSPQAPRATQSTTARRGGKVNNRRPDPVNSSAWRDWNAKESDAAIAERLRKEAAEQKKLNLPPATIVDDFRSITVHNGERIVGKKTRMVHKPVASPNTSTFGGLLDDQPGTFKTPAMIPSNPVREAGSTSQNASYNDRGNTRRKEKSEAPVEKLIDFD